MSSKFSLLIALVLLLAASCGNRDTLRYGKVLKSKNIQEKFDYAVKYYNEGDCYKAVPIFDELIGLVRGTALYEDVYYYYAKTNYCIEDYYLSNYYAKNFARTFSNSPRAEELMFISAMSSYNNSPNYSLDQQDTRAALDEFQFFLDNYPNSEHKDSCENMMLLLSYNLERKDFEVAQLYVKTRKYKSATIALETMLAKYPDSQFREDLFFLRTEAWYEYAKASITSKQEERFNQTVQFYNTLARSYPNSKFLDEAEDFYRYSLSELISIAENKNKDVVASLDSLDSESISVTQKEELVVDIQDFYRPFEKELINSAEALVENENYSAGLDLLDYGSKKFTYSNFPLKTSFLMLKSKFGMIAKASEKKKPKRYQEFTESYTTFVRDFSSSTYVSEAEIMKKRADELIAELN